jgi:hypothetical protein
MLIFITDYMDYTDDTDLEFSALVGWPDRRRWDYATGETNDQTGS